MASYQLAKDWDCLPSSTAKSSRHGMNVNVYNFQAAVKKLLNKKEQKDLTNILQCYNRNRNAYFLSQSVKRLLESPEKKCIYSLLKQIIPKSDRASFDQFTCEETYVCRSGHSRGSSLSHLYTNDSGIGSHSHEHDCASKASDFSNYKQTSRSNQIHRRSSSLSDLNRKSEKSKSLAGTFGSAVRRKVRAVLARRGSSSGIELKSSIQRRYNSETKLNKIGQQKEKATITSASSKSEEKTLHGSTSSLIKISLRRGKQKEFGFTIGGGSEVGSGIFVSNVEPASPAHEAGLSKGDVIVKVNEMQFNAGVAHDTAVAVLSTLDNLTMLVQPLKSPKYKATDLPWTDVHGRPASPPHTVSKRGNHFPKPVLDSRRSSVHLLQAGERKVNLTVRSKQSLGLVIRGGSEYGLGIYVTGVDSLSAAEIAGLKVGDEILEVNNVRLIGATHAEAVSVIKSSPILMMTVRYVGRVPQNNLAPFDDRISLHSTMNRSNDETKKEKRNGIRANFQRKVMNEKQMILPNKSVVKVSAIMSTLEDALLSSSGWLSLTDFERRSVRYYVKEYAVGNVDTDALVLTLTELLDSSEKLALMSAVRKCIDSKDLDHFDVLLLRKEVDSLRSLQDLQMSKNNSSCSIDSSSQLSATSEDHSFLRQSSSDFQNSTPVEHCTRPSQLSENNLSLSPVAPSDLIPTPPVKIAPQKPKRSVSLTRKSALESFSSSATDEEFADVPSSSSNDQRSRSPFAVAIENHRSSHSGRVKAGNKSGHKPLPNADFFKDPKDDIKPTQIEPVYSTVIKPVKNPVSNLVKQQKPLQNSVFNNTNQNAPSSLNASSSSLVVDPSPRIPSPHPPLHKISLRPASFGSFGNQKVNTYQHPVKVEVHRDPSLKREKPDTQPPPQADNIKQTFTSGIYNSYTEENDEVPPFLKPDVEMQKVVIFRRASNLGLTVEGGAGTKQSMPRVLQIQPGSCAQLSGRIEVGHVIHEVNGDSLTGLEHHDAVRVIALAFKQEDRDSIEFVLSGPY